MQSITLPPPFKMKRKNNIAKGEKLYTVKIHMLEMILNSGMQDKMNTTRESEAFEPERMDITRH